MLVQNDYFDMYVEGYEVLLDLKKTGYPLKSFDMITREHPRVRISSFPALRKALTEIGDSHKIGTYLPMIEIEISNNKMKAEFTLNVNTAEFENSKEELVRKIENALDEYGIIFGRIAIDMDSLVPGRLTIAALGKEPTQGADAKILYIDKPERKPIIREDGVADYYEMNFVTHIKSGDWLGEKVPPQEGTPGSDIMGNPIKALRGNDAKLRYDRKSVVEVEEPGKTVLRAMFGGSLEFIDGETVSVGKQLIINGDVGPETGSITFDGAVTVYGTVLAGYSVNATGDISIEGNEGITNAKEICSAEGDLYIKGGVFGGDLSIIEASGDIFIKHANNCKLHARELHVGLYILGSDVVAQNVFVDKNRGKIIGGRIEALYKIECAYAGNSHERTTHLHAKGINKDMIYQEIQEMAVDLKKIQATTTALEGQLTQIDNHISSKLLGEQALAYEKLQATLNASRNKMFELDREIQLGLHKIKTAIAPQIEITKEANPGVIIQIGNKSSILNKLTKGVFEVVDEILNV
ncbi:FapA family protein [Sporosarcina oncorhynchi]|uniref:FapA family protein n=1 Tax=Sporosarcina oncorhynchi TaxID=3056444 RepID=A0ABZ0L8M4_9BACL|nr:FapA family protein [Sporosarcina sp. T2O-4]WOV88897.1 FapA family protein [Sporosarcina sp. T2O-4]